MADQNWDLIKYGSHADNIADIPVSNRLVQVSRPIKHAVHVSDIGDLPIAQWLNEIGRLMKEICHVGGTRCGPCSSAFLEEAVLEVAIAAKDMRKV